MCTFLVCFPVIFIVSSNIISSNLECIPEKRGKNRRPVLTTHTHAYAVHIRKIFVCHGRYWLLSWFEPSRWCRPYARWVYVVDMSAKQLVFRYFHLYVYECVNVVSAFDYNNQQTHTYFFVMLRIFFHRPKEQKHAEHERARWINKRHHYYKRAGVYTRILMIYISMVCE